MDLVKILFALLFVNLTTLSGVKNILLFLCQVTTILMPIISTLPD